MLALGVEVVGWTPHALEVEVLGGRIFGTWSTFVRYIVREVHNLVDETGGVEAVRCWIPTAGADLRVCAGDPVCDAAPSLPMCPNGNPPHRVP